MEQEKRVCNVLDQTQPKLLCILEKDTYNPSIETINKTLSYVADNYSDVCGFTLTFKKSFHNDDDKWLHRHVHKSLLNQKDWKRVKYIIFPEFTPKKGVLHYHGIIWDEYEITIMRCLKYWRRKYGFAKPELKLNSIYNWIKYITKDYMKTGLWTITNLIPSECGKTRTKEG